MLNRVGIVHLSAVAAALLLAFAPSAVAATPVALDAPDNGNNPLVAFSPIDGNTYVAWSAPANQNNGNGVDLCILPPNKTVCEGGAPVLLTDTNTGALTTNPSNTVGLGGLVILPTSGEVVVLGTPVETGTVAWASKAGGADFLTGDNGLQNAGNFISPVSLFYTTNNAAAINSTDVAIFDSYDHSWSEFSDSPFDGPKTPATLASDPCPSNPLGESGGNANNCGQFDDQGDTQGPVIAAEPTPGAATGTYTVVGAGANVSSNELTPTGCINDSATGYGVDVGTTGPSGTLNSQGLQPNGFGLLACAAEDPTLASGGATGIGVLEVEGNGVSGAAPASFYGLDWRPFIATSTGGAFAQTPTQITQLPSTPDYLDVAEDSGDGVYAMFQDGGLYVAYSPNKGVNWDTPVLVPQPTNGEISNPTIAGVGNGVVEIAFKNDPGTGSQTWLQTLSAIPPTPVTLTTSQTAGTTTGANISVPAGTIGETDTATLAGAHAATATGTVDYALYGDKSCTGTRYLASTENVTAGVAASAAPVTTALVPGTYYWSAAYSGDANNDSASSGCGAEVLTITPSATAASTGTTNGTTVTTTITCAGPCTVTVTITVPSGGAADIASVGRRKGGALTIATGRFSLKSAGRKKLTLKLTAQGRSLLRKHHDTLRSTLALSDKTAHGTFKSTRTLKITKKR